jgi:hypothetical protein
MIRAHATVALAAGLALLLASEAPAQPGSFAPRAVTPTPFSVLVLNGIDDPNVAAELKLSDEQVKALVARRQAVWGELYVTAPAKDDDATRTAATDALLKKTLSDAQYKRAVQLGAQSALGLRRFSVNGEEIVPSVNRLRVTPPMFSRYPELADVFKLTEEQKKALTERTPIGDGGFFGGRAVIPTPEQQAAAKEFMGPVFTKSWTAKTDPRFAAIPAQPREIGLLSANDVWTDVGLTDEQGRAVAAVREKWTKLATDRRTTISPKEAAVVATALAAESEKALAAALRPEQAARLKQIIRQTDGPGSHVDRFYTSAEAAREISLTAEQVKALDGVWAAFRQDATKAFEAGEPFAATEKRVKELVAARQAKAEAVLTPEQAAKVRDLYGKPFTGSTFDFVGGFRIDEMRAATFGKYSGEFVRLAGDEAIHAELKMTPEQVKKAGEVRDDLIAKFRNPSPVNAEAFAKAAAERSGHIEAELKKLLTAGQAKRFREIMLQARESGPNIPVGARSAVVASAAAYPGVAEEVKLTAEQKKALIAGTAPAEVLTAEQKGAIAKMLGKPFEGAAVARAIRAPFAPLPQPSAFVRAMVVRNEPLEKALTLTPEQAKAIDAAREAYQDVNFAAGPPSVANREARAKAMAAAIEAFDRAVTATLTPQQVKRIPQLALQADAAANLNAALTTADVARALELTAEQTAKLAAVAEDAQKVQQLLVTDGPPDVPERKLALRLRDAADERMMAVLTDAQRAKWKELTGEPVAGLRKTIPGRFGRGGFAGGPGFVFDP